MPDRSFRRFEINSADELRKHLRTTRSLVDHILHGVDLRGVPELTEADVGNCLILGCTFESIEQRHDLELRGAHVFPGFPAVPFEPYRRELYTADELLEGYAEGGYTGTRDFRIYAYFDRARNSRWGTPLRDGLAQRLHDFAIDDALAQFVEDHGGRTVVGVMGGHGTRRDDPDFAKVVKMCRALTRRGFLIATGGGPGVMEAGNLGAYLANFEDEGVIDAALEILSEAPSFNGGLPEGTPEYLGAIAAYIAAASRCREALAGEALRRRCRAEGPPGRSLAVPTWFYGHEPTNLFCDHVAKYFSNGLREDVLLAISRGGVVFAPGSAGTLQEIFMDLAQNHYATFVDRSPMVFLDSTRFGSVFRLIQEFIERRGMSEMYGDLVAMFDDPMEIVAFIEANPPRERIVAKALYELLGE